MWTQIQPLAGEQLFQKNGSFVGGRGSKNSLFLALFESSESGEVLKRQQHIFTIGEEVDGICVTDGCVPRVFGPTDLILPMPRCAHTNWFFAGFSPFVENTQTDGADRSPKQQQLLLLPPLPAGVLAASKNLKKGMAKKFTTDRSMFFATIMCFDSTKMLV